MSRTSIALAIAAACCASAAFAQTTGPDNGRLLASNCMQCHGTRGQPRANGFSDLADKSAREIVKELAEMAALLPGREPEEDIMAVHAKAYTRAEIDLIAKYLGGN